MREDIHLFFFVVIQRLFLRFQLVDFGLVADSRGVGIVAGGLQYRDLPVEVRDLDIEILDLRVQDRLAGTQAYGRIIGLVGKIGRLESGFGRSDDRWELGQFGRAAYTLSRAG